MKKILFILLCFVTISVHAQDVIVKKDGSVIQSKVLEVNETNIRYKKFSNQNGPTYTISIKDVLAINYANGEKDTFEDVPSNDGEMKINIVQPDSHNAELIARYNKPHSINEKKTGKAAKYGFIFLGVEENSILSSDELDIEIPTQYWLYTYNIQIHNKSDKPLYIDLGNTFRVISNGDSKVYFTGSQSTTISQGGSSGVGVNMGAVAGALGVGGVLGTLAGGVSVGGSESNTTHKTYTQQRVKVIPPHGKVLLEQSLRVNGETIYEDERYWIGDKYKQVAIGDAVQYDIKSSPFSAQYTITYSHSENISDMNVVKVGIFVKEIAGVSKYGKMYSKQKTFERFLPNDDYSDKYIIMGYWAPWRK